MLTYVINTSENKTFECERLFSLVGYNKIRWKSCRLDEINKCAQEIYDSQNSITASRFQIAVIVDFVCFERQLVIEVDGGYHSEPHQQEEDLSRTESLGRMGFDVIRFTNEQVIENQQEVIREIKEILYNE